MHTETGGAANPAGLSWVTAALMNADLIGNIANISLALSLIVGLVFGISQAHPRRPYYQTHPVGQKKR